jgi:hypothetical protein
MIDCALCKRSFQFGPHRYDGRKVQAWDVMLCSTCVSGNWDGIVPGSWPGFIKDLEARGIAIKLNDQGWLPIPA